MCIGNESKVQTVSIFYEEQVFTGLLHVKFFFKHFTHWMNFKHVASNVT